MASLELRLLGDFEARDAGRLIGIKAKKNRALLAALALAPSGSLPRGFIASLLWSDRGEAQARSSLRQALVGLRDNLAAIDPPLLLIGDARVRLDLPRLDVDALAFLKLAGSSDGAALRGAAALYRGDLLADTDIRDPVFEEWLGSERRRLAEVASGVLEKLCDIETGAARIDVAKRLVALDPAREASHRKLMRVYLEAGERNLVLRQYDVCVAMLREEFGVAPDEETEALHRLSSLGATPRQNSGEGEGRAARVHDDKPSVAVLPFAVIGGDNELEHFSDGLTEDVITGLSRISAIVVIARNTMLAYKRQAVDVREIGHELGARYILEGSVRRSGTRLRVSAQLTDAESGRHIWAERFERDHAELFELQDDFTSSIVASVQTQLILYEGKVKKLADRVSHLLARSWQRFLSLSEESLAECRAMAERALDLDGRSAMAHRMLAIAVYHQVYMGFIPWTEENIDELYSHASASLRFDDADEYCHWAMECAHLLKKQHKRAFAALQRALEINPNCSLAHGSMGTVLAWSGQYDASIKRNEFAIRINPQDPSNFYRRFGLALAHYFASRYDTALSHAEAVNQTRPGWWLAQIVHAATLAQLGRSEEAWDILNELKRARPDLQAGSLDVLPFANASDRDHLLEGLRKAGLAG